MANYIIIFVVAITTLSSTLFQTGPKLKIDKKEINIGDLPTGAKVNIQIKLKNVGDQPLQIKAIKASCGCTTAKKSNIDILPGKSDIITLNFNAYGMNGRIKKIVQICSNDQMAPSQRVSFEANIIREFELLGPGTIIDFQNQIVGKKSSEIIGFRNVSGHTIRVNGATTQSHIIQAITSKKSIAAGDTVWVKIIMLPRIEGYSEEEFVLETNSDKVPRTVFKVACSAVLPK